MSLRLTKRMTVCAIVAALMSGCATVDLNEMATPVSAQASEVELNVVQRAVGKLKTAFASKGFVEKTSRKRMQSAAKILLNGLEDKNVTQVSGDSGYVAMAKPVSVVLEDIRFAKTHVEKTTKAAEVYLEMAPADRKISKELKSLEVALLAAKEAGRVFEVALGRPNDADVLSYNRTVSNLREITDEFGARVRVQNSQKLALHAATI